MRRHPFSLSVRSSGLLFHPTSLPGPFGIGDIGPEAYRFIDFLSSARQTWWQMFPVGPSGYGGAPYQPLSAFAGNPLLISPDLMREEGLLTLSELKAGWMEPSDTVNFGRSWSVKYSLLRKAFMAFQSGEHRYRSDFEDFVFHHKSWLEDYALFCVLKDKHRKAPWFKWDIKYRKRKSSAVEAAKSQFRISYQFHLFLQYVFHTQWNRLKSYAAGKNIGLIGDIPIFVSHDSADVWAHPDLFLLDKKGQLRYMAGTPPDYFSRIGQKWGNPLYDWNNMKKNGYQWWINRFRRTFDRFDAARIDHFIGFERYWRIPRGHKTAVHGKWMPGPKVDFFRQVRKTLGRLDIIAEDLGAVTKEVEALRDRFEFPGMKVLQFAFEGKANPHIPHNYSPRCVVYTGTHDNDTTVGWFKNLKRFSRDSRGDSYRREIEFIKRYLNTDGKNIAWDMIRLASSSVAALSIFPVQDLLGLGSEARMNTPGTEKGNWVWRMKRDALTPAIAKRLNEITLTYDRSPS